MAGGARREQRVDAAEPGSGHRFTWRRTASRMASTGGSAAQQEDIMGLDDIVDKAKDLAGDAAEKAKDVAGDVAEKAKDVAGDVADRAKDVADEVKDRADHLIHGDDDKPESAPASGGTGM
jgi:ElaB/YqjD/DUF883 family membrane-anchored ribosome-binding protein